ncbi:MAG TPA: winged helix-turn-helix domain-containing protein, partial [Streptosporangiaceae bacterium]
MSGDTESIRVQLLGPVGAWRGRHELALGGPRQQTVFSMLAMRANRLVSRAELIDGLWGAELPASPVNGLHVYIAGLRQVLEPHRANRAPGQVLRGSGPGYLLQLDPARLDAAELGRLLAPARPGPARNAPAAGQLAALDAALGLWQGIPLVGLPGPWADIERARLGELRLAAIEQRTDVLLAL